VLSTYHTELKPHSETLETGTGLLSNFSESYIWIFSDAVFTARAQAGRPFSLRFTIKGRKTTGKRQVVL
jgi:hypothetical protein